jgi:hypothetical protein
MDFQLFMLFPQERASSSRKCIELSRRIFYGAKLAKLFLRRVIAGAGLFLRRVTAGAGLFLRRVTAGAEEETVTAAFRMQSKSNVRLFYTKSIDDIHSSC